MEGDTEETQLPSISVFFYTNVYYTFAMYILYILPAPCKYIPSGITIAYIELMDLIKLRISIRHLTEFVRTRNSVV